MTHEKGCAWIDEEYGEADVCLTCGDDTTWPCRPYLMQRNTELEAAVTRVRGLAASWTGRGEHLLAHAKTVPDDIADALLDSGTDWIDKARMLRSAVDKVPLDVPRLRACVEAWPDCATVDTLPTAKAGGFPPQPAPCPRKEQDVLRRQQRQG